MAAIGIGAILLLLFLLGCTLAVIVAASRRWSMAASR